MAKPIEQWRGTDEFLRLLEEMRQTLAGEDRNADAVAIAMANLQGMFDWYQIANEIDLSAERIEAEFARYDEAFEEVTIQQRM